eukprot:scaffold112337_cov69-Phaeocystis_antarctica.AAC.3
MVFSLGQRQRRQLRLALAEAGQVVGRPDSRARVTHNLADGAVGGGRVHRQSKVLPPARVNCVRGEASQPHNMARESGPVCATESSREAHSGRGCFQSSGRRSATPW